MRSNNMSSAEKQPDALSTANLQSHNDVLGNTEIDRKTQMESLIKYETGLGFERGLSKHYRIGQLGDSNPDLAMSVARQAVEEQSAEHWIRLTNRIYGRAPTQSCSPMEQYCIVTTVDSPNSNTAHDSLKNSGIEPGVLEHADIRSKATEEAANFPAKSHASSTSGSEEEVSTALERDLGIEPGRSAIEVDQDDGQGDMRLARPSIRNIRQGPQQNQRRVHKKIKKQKRRSKDNRDAAKHKSSSNTSMKVNAESRTTSEERRAYECRGTYQDMSSPPMHGVGGWTSPEPGTCS